MYFLEHSEKIQICAMYMYHVESKCIMNRRLFQRIVIKLKDNGCTFTPAVAHLKMRNLESTLLLKVL